jgi:hypothetical protein
MATVAVILTWATFRHQLRATKREIEDLRATQARLVWCELVSKVGDPDSGCTAVLCKVHNDSSAPVFDVRMHPLSGIGIRSIMFPGMTRSAGGIMVAVKSVPGGATTEFEYKLLTPEPWYGFYLNDEGGVTVEGIVHFTDAAGLEWERRGSLRPVRHGLTRKSLLSLTFEFTRAPSVWRRLIGIPLAKFRGRLESHLFKREMRARKELNKHAE